MIGNPVRFLCLLLPILFLSCDDTGYPFIVVEDQVDVPYTLGASGTVDVLVQNSCMMTVRTLVSGEEQGAGNHSVTWDLMDDSGEYPGDGLYTVEVYLEGERVSVTILEVNRQ